MGDMVRVRFQNDADLPSYIDLKVGEVYEMEDYSETHFLWCGVHSFSKWRFDLVGEEKTTEASKQEIANEILDLQQKVGGLSGDDYWKALYRIKELAGQLATLTLDL